MMIEAENFRNYYSQSDIDETRKVDDDLVFDLRPLFLRDPESSCVLDLSDIFTDRSDSNELKFFENHFSKEETHLSEPTETKDISIRINIPSSNDFDSMLPTMSDILPTPSLGRGFFRIFGKSTPKPHIKTSPQIKTEDDNVFVKLFKKKEPKPCEVADLTSKEDRPVYNKSPKKSNKKLKVGSKPLLKKDIRDVEQNDKKHEIPIASDDSTVLDKSIVESDTSVKEDTTSVINSFVTELPHRTKLLDDNRKLVVKNESLRRKSRVLRHKIVDNLIVRNTNMYLDLLDYTHNIEILKTLLRCVSESRKNLYVDLTFIKDKPTLHLV